ncbi:beta-ketoacyl synthase chain length factor [Halomonas sp. M20]|uniref:beta-ketoacyl synthase chain length factor n=1 Tax=Halomonas sp. M20 TaxID=2763264 RepID=UPI001D0A38E8|nr:beta-ketoacyl synthase chain length factor [Halomonas sp. M20]
MNDAPLILEDWRAWYPGRTPARDPRLSVEERPAASRVAPMLRRRLNNSGRAVCDMLAELDPAAECVLLHASRHGDSERTLEMLYALNEDIPLSPARFGMAVHNAMIGVHSIASGNRRSLQAIAASGAEVSALFSEALGYLMEGEKQVVAVFSDAPVPPRFADHTQGPSNATAVAMRLGMSAAVSGGQSLTAHSADEATCHGYRPLQPDDVIAWLLGETPLVCPIRRRVWKMAS